MDRLTHTATEEVRTFSKTALMPSLRIPYSWPLPWKARGIKKLKHATKKRLEDHAIYWHRVNDEQCRDMEGPTGRTDHESLYMKWKDQPADSCQKDFNQPSDPLAWSP